MTEKKVFILSIILLIFFISFTHLAGLLNANKDFYYTGLQPTRRGDMPGHLSFVIQAQDGNFLFKNLYNPTEQQALFFHPLWLTMGWTAKISGLNLAFIYHLFRVIFAIIFCFILKRFLWQFYDLRYNIWLFPFCLFSGGFFTWLIEKDTFLNLYYSPLFSLVLIFLIIIFHSTLNFFRNKNSRYLLIIFVTTLFLFLIHFYDTVPLLGIVFLWCIYQYLKTKKINNFFPALSIIFGLLPGVIYYYLIFSAEPALNRWAVNNVTLLPGWQFLFFGFGLLTPLAIIGVIIKRKQQNFIFLLFWLLTLLFFIFSPIPFNRRFVLGISVPLAIFAYYGLKYILDLLKNNQAKIFVGLLMFLFLFQGVFFITIFDLILINYRARPQYLPRNYWESFLFMKENFNKNSVIMANFDYWDTEISGYSGLTSYMAGGYFTSFNENYDKIRWIYENNQSLLEKRQFLLDNNIDYLFYSEKEKRLGDFNPSEINFLKLIYKNQDVEIYQFIN